MRAPALLPALLVAAASLAGAQDAGPESRPAPAKKPAPKDEAPKPQPPAKVPARVAFERQLAKTTVHFEFMRAPLGDIFQALERATDVRVRIGKRARRALAKRKLKIKYVASRTGVQVLVDLCKAAALDFLITDEGVIVDEPAVIKALRRRLDLGGKALKLTNKDVRSLLKTKTISLALRERPLSEFLRLMRQETGVRFVSLTPTKAGKPEPRVSVTTSASPLREVLNLAIHSIDHDWVVSGNVILVGDKKTIAEQRKPQPKPKAPKKPE